jgi:hypothetical protein
MRTFTTSPAWDFTVSIGRSTASTVPLIRVGDGCCAYDGAAKQTVKARSAREAERRI